MDPLFQKIQQHLNHQPKLKHSHALYLQTREILANDVLRIRQEGRDLLCEYSAHKARSQSKSQRSAGQKEIHKKRKQLEIAFRRYNWFVGHRYVARIKDGYGNFHITKVCYSRQHVLQERTKLRIQLRKWKLVGNSKHVQLPEKVDQRWWSASKVLRTVEPMYAIEYDEVYK